MLKVTKKPQGFTLFLEDTFLEKPQGKGRGGQIDYRCLFRVKKLVYLFYSLPMLFGKRRKVRRNHFNVYVVVNDAVIINKHFFLWYKVHFENFK